MQLLVLLTFLLGRCSAASIETSPVRGKAVTPKLSGGTVVFGSGTYPRANSLSDGSILGIYTAFSGGKNIIKTVRTTNGGASWQAWGTVHSGPSNATEIDNPYVLQLPSGRVLCAFRNHSKDPRTGAYTFFRITIFYSNDMGKTWAYLSQPTSDPGPVNGYWEPFLRYNTQYNTLQTTGATWTAPTTISGIDITSRDGMTGVATISGSTLMAVFESEINGFFSIVSVTSTDSGKTWGNRNTIYTPTAMNTSAGAPQIINVGCTLVVSFQTNEDMDSECAIIKLSCQLSGEADYEWEWG